ncbi:MAG: tyrosyl-tRNA synthetase [Solirubrobacteraceae bacterium]|jgi:tyrosyl-tRNA synthetase|nr:tyrosyl-tRNA synthetase [Solirubrobacteraceae bacterium]
MNATGQSDSSIGRVTGFEASEAAFLARDAVDCLPEGALERKLAAGRPLRVKLGLDPTAPDVHLGHTVVLRKLREFQDRGHVVVLIIGDYTARVGDPSGRSTTRPVLSGEQIDANARTYVEQAATVLDPDRIELRHNSEWLDMRMEELFALARTTTVAQLLERDDFSRRHAAREPISILELLYPLMQAYDSVAVRADVELGGTDQKFNLLLGRDVQRAYGLDEQVALTMPILAGLDGERKMSKSLGNHIGVGEAPQEIYGKTLSLPDAAMAGWYGLLLGECAPAGLSARDAKHALARRLVERFHSAAAADAAAAHFDRVFVQRELPEEIEEARFDGSGELVHLPALIAESFGRSRADARRLLGQGAVRLDGHTLAGEDLDVVPERLDGAVLQVGKRGFRRLRRLA